MSNNYTNHYTLIPFVLVTLLLHVVEDLLCWGLTIIRKKIVSIITTWIKRMLQMGKVRNVAMYIIRIFLSIYYYFFLIMKT